MSTTNIDRRLPLDVMSLRSDFPILASSIHGDKPLVYLDNSATTQRPQQVIQAITEMYEKHFANVHRGIHWLSDQSTDRYEEAREKVRSWINAARSTEVIFTTGTTAGINLVARSWGDQFVQEGDEILLTEMEHHSNLVPWHQLAARSGCRIRHHSHHGRWPAKSGRLAGITHRAHQTRSFDSRLKCTWHRQSRA